MRLRFPAMRLVLAALGGAALTPLADAAAITSQPSVTGHDGPELKMDIDVIAQRLDLARQQIQPSLGATTYNFSPEALQNIPQGEAAPLNQVLLQDPGTAHDS